MTPSRKKRAQERLQRIVDADLARGPESKSEEIVSVDLSMQELTTIMGVLALSDLPGAVALKGRLWPVLRDLTDRP